MRRLFNVCKIGKGNADLLHEALVYAKPEDLKEGGLIQVCPVNMSYSSLSNKGMLGILHEMPRISGAHYLPNPMGVCGGGALSSRCVVRSGDDKGETAR